MILRAALLASSVSLLGCGRATSEVVAPQAGFPVSFSRSVRDAEGTIVSQRRQEVVGHFEAGTRTWAMVYGLADLRTKTDLSPAINEQVGRARGEAIVRLTVRSKPCALNFVPILTLLPFWPGCSNLLASGDIIRVRPDPPPVRPPQPVPKMPEATPPRRTLVRARFTKLDGR